MAFSPSLLSTMADRLQSDRPAPVLNLTFVNRDESETWSLARATLLAVHSDGWIELAIAGREWDGTRWLDRTVSRFVNLANVTDFEFVR